MGIGVNRLSLQRKSRHEKIVLRPSDLDFSIKGIKLTGNVRLFQRVNGRWYVRFTLNGKRRMLSTGETDRTKALLKISEIVREAELEDTLGRKVKTDVTLSELAKEYTPYAEANKAPSTLYRDKSRMRKLLETFGKKKLSEITGRDIERYMQSRRKEGKQPATVNREFALLRHMLRKAVEWDYLSVSPARTVKPFKESPGRVRYLSDSERERLLGACSGMLKAVVLTALLTGMRKGELQGLTWDDVDFERREITLKRTKNNEVRVIPIGKDLLPVLHRLHNERPYSHYVFSKPDGRPYGNWRKAFTTACRQTGIKDFRFHDLRHTFASYLAMAGHSAFTIQRLMGHKTIAMAQRYTHLSQAHIRAAVDQIGAKVVQSEEGLDGQSRKLSNNVAPVAQKDRASDF